MVPGLEPITVTVTVVDDPLNGTFTLAEPDTNPPVVKMVLPSYVMSKRSGTENASYANLNVPLVRPKLWLVIVVPAPPLAVAALHATVPAGGLDAVTGGIGAVPAGVAVLSSSSSCFGFGCSGTRRLPVDAPGLSVPLRSSLSTTASARSPPAGTSSTSSTIRSSWSSP